METKQQTTRLVAVVFMGALMFLGVWAHRAGLLNRDSASEVFENHHFACVTAVHDSQAGH